MMTLGEQIVTFGLSSSSGRSKSSASGMFVDMIL